MKKDTKPTAAKSIIVAGNAGEDVFNGEETEVAAQIHVPPEGGWSWVVLTASFFIIFIIDGCAMTFGAMINDITFFFKVADSVAALVNSVEVSLYYMFSPVASALINRFGFRTVALIGSMLASVGLFAAYFSSNFASLVIFLGVVTGIGDSMINMSAGLIVGFYFEKHRSLAMAISSGGSAAGCMTLYPVNSILVKRAGFKNTLLLHAGLHGLIYFLSLAFRPLLALTVTQTEEEGNPTKTVTFLPTISAAGKGESANKATAAERMLGAVSNVHFPTAAQFFKDAGTPATTSLQTPSTSGKPPAVSRITLQAQGEVNTRQLKQMQSIVSRIQMQDTKTQTHTEITVQAQERQKKPWYRRIFDWEADSPESRPMYRDDAFYDGKVENLPVYQKSVAVIKEEARTGLEYQLAVSRAVRVNDIQERRGVCTIAVRRVLVSMVDPGLLKKKSYLLFCLSGLLTNVGTFVPYVFLQDRNLKAGLEPSHCSLFVSVLSLSNLIGRLVISYLASKIPPIYIYSSGLVLAGACTICSDLSYSLAFQYGYSAAFGWFIAVSSGLRSITIVSLYGLERLTNATGVIMLFLGVGNLISTPLGGALKNSYGYRYSFITAGSFIVAAGVIALPVAFFASNEDANERKAEKKANDAKAAEQKPNQAEKKANDAKAAEQKPNLKSRLSTN